MGALSQNGGKIAAVVVLLGLAVWYGMFRSRDAAALPNRVEFVCVQTGKVFSINRADMPSILPGPNPDTGAATLLPIVRRDDGSSVVSDRAKSLVTELTASKLNAYVNPETLEVLDAPLAP